jgi:predicted transcriptional regulator
MQPKKITFRAPFKNIKALDALAAARQCSRSLLLNEAIDEYLALNEQWKAQIKEGIRQADAGETVSHEEVRARFASLISSHDR